MNRLLAPSIALLTLACCAPVARYAEQRALDLADCFKCNVGVGVGLAVDVHLTDYMAPGLGIASYTANVGWDDRRVNGVWLESDVINTPRIAYEWFFDEFEETPDGELEQTDFLARFAFASITLPNERWIRKQDRVTVEYFSLFNFGGWGGTMRAASFVGLLLERGEEPRDPRRTVWQKCFFEAAATAGVVHARVGWNPLETIDFALGVFGLDPAGDSRLRLGSRPAQ